MSALSFIQQHAFDADPREDLIVIAVHPGYMDTDMTSHIGPLTIEQGSHSGRNIYANHSLLLHSQRTCEPESTTLILQILFKRKYSSL